MEPIENLRSAKNLTLHSNRSLCGFSCVGSHHPTPCAMQLRSFYLHLQVKNIQLGWLYHRAVAARFFSAHSSTVLQDIVPDRVNGVGGEEGGEVL